MRRDQLWGAAAALTLVFTWAGNLVATRYSTHNGLTPMDLMALRFLVAGVILLPAFCKLDWATLGGLGWRRALTLTFLSGSPYMLVFFSALSLAPAAHGAVLNPGITPTVVFLAMVALKRRSFSLIKSCALGLIFGGLILVTSSSFSSDGDILLGDLLFLYSGVSWGLFTLLLGIWEIQPMSSATIISVLSAAIGLPAYLAFTLFTGNGLPTASLTHIALQGVYQGLIGSILALCLLALVVKRHGAQITSLFSPLVPLAATLLAIPFLGEIPSPSQWLGVALVTLGIFGVAKSG